MLDEYIKEQPIAIKILKNAIKKNRLVHAYLFETNGYNKSEELIFSFIKSLLCPNNFFVSCENNNCNICTMLNDRCYPELKIINPDGMWIKKEQLDELQEEFSKKAILGTKKIYIINQAEKMNSSAANSLLKFLEEPVLNVIAILVTNNIYQLLDTIVSRCQVISLNKNNIKFETELEMIANYIFSDKIKREDFISDSENLENIKNAKKFVEYYENNHLDTLLYTQKLWFNYFKDKEQNLLAYDIITLYYRDILNLKIGHALLFFKDDSEILLKIANKNSEASICEKITKILKAKQKIKNNINLNLLLDNLIIDLECR